MGHQINDPSIRLSFWGRLGVFFFIGFQCLALFYALNLEQNNHETLFLAKSGQASYQEFLDQFEEPHVVLVKLDFNQKLIPQQYQAFLVAVQELQKKFPDAQLLTLYDLVQQSVEDNTLEALLKLKREKAKANLNLLGENHLALLAVFPESATKANLRQLILQIKQHPYFSQQNLNLSGLPYINFLLDQYSDAIKVKLMPLVFGVIFLFTLLLTRSWFSTIVIVVPGIAALLSSMAYVKYYYQSLNMVTSIVPLMMFVLNLSLSFHLYFTLLECGCIRQTFRKKLAPILLMALTTCIGFGTLIVSEIPAIRQFGILSATLILGTSALTVFWAFLLYEWKIKKGHQAVIHTNLSRWFTRGLPKKYLFPISALIILLTFFAYQKVPFNTEATSYFPDKSGIRESMKSIERDLWGLPLLEMTLALTSKQNLSYDDLLQIDKIETEIENVLKGGKVLLSPNQMVKEANYIYGIDDSMPDFESAYYTLRDQIFPLVRDNYPFEKKYRMTLLGSAVGYQQYLNDIEKIQSLMAKFPKFEVTYNGLYYHLMNAQRSLIKTLIYSLSLSLLVILSLFSIYARRLSLIFSFLLANILPLMMAVMFIYAMGFSFNVATVMVFSISLGIVVDSTLHIIHSLRDDVDHSYQSYFETTILPILLSSFILTAAFSMFIFYGFVPIRQFGTTLAFTLFIALLVDVFIVPSLVTGKVKMIDFFKKDPLL